MRALRQLLARLWPSRRSDVELDGARLVIRRRLWDELLTQLDVRGLHGQREAGAFLLAPNDGDGHQVARVVYLDDLDPDCLVGGIHFHGSGYSKLWTLCEQEALQVVADVHTHPAGWVSQSEIDRANPMIALRGHLALILPDSATRKIEPPEVGVHEYRGDDGWLSAFGADAARLLRVLD